MYKVFTIIAVLLILAPAIIGYILQIRIVAGIHQSVVICLMFTMKYLIIIIYLKWNI